MKFLEEERLQIVQQYEQLKLDNNKELNDLVALAIEIFDVPMCIISFMDADEQLIKCKAGINITESSRENSFCKHLINTKRVIIIPDTLTDERVLNNTTVTGHLAIRFYAGAPLITISGHHLGSLCVLDKIPRLFSNKQKDMLAILSRQVISIIELQMGLTLIKARNSELTLQKKKTAIADRKLRAFFNSSASCHALINKGLKVLDFNNAMAVFTKRFYHKNIEVGKNITSFITPSYKEEFMTHIENAFEGKRINKEILMGDGKDTGWWNITFKPIRDEKGNIINVATSATNINDKKQQLVQIKAQNKLLFEIAYIQSHEYRKPVASILGLMNVIKESNYRSGKKCFILMEKAVKDLDDKIRNVVNLISNYAVNALK
ncbi:MAG: domain S-box protein [Mucilaginibacter sp.]|nr:domain S-box protein [Mucilaginibacter sp.]